MDIKGTEGADTLAQSQPSDDWNNYFGLGGNDIIRLFQGTALGGAGDDRIERIATADWWRAINAAYWDSPSGVVVDLAGGWAEDGWGGRDTLVGVRDITGSWHDDRLYGDGNDNTIYPGGGGHSIVDGRGGDDLVWLPVFTEGMPLSAFSIDVAIDGASAVVTMAGQPEFLLEISNIERIGVGYNLSYNLADFIAPQKMAVQGLLGTDANRWNAGRPLGSAVELTYSFADYTEAQKAAVRAILDSVALATNMDFREAAGATGLRFGASQQAATKGLAAMPGQAGAGQVLMDVDSLADVTPGSEGYAALLHEIGHALGLRHPRNTDAGDAWGAQWRAVDDVTNYSVMAHGASADGLFPSSFSALDITALRALYGSRSVNAGDTVYQLGGLRFTSQTSIVDDGGKDTIDASASNSGVEIDLTPGRLSSVGVTALGAVAVDNLGIAPGSWIEAATGSRFDDVLVGNSLDNLLRGGLGNDWIDGGAGSDTALFEGARADYLVSTGFGKVFVTARDGSSGFDTLLGVETLRFSDASLALRAGAQGADAAIAVDQDASVAGTLPPSSDGAALAYALKSAPANGTLVLAANGDYVYTPRIGFGAEDRFVFSVTDARGASNDYMGFVSVRALPGVGGSAGDDMLSGSAGNDNIAAAAGNDQVGASAGFDRIDGGEGFDLVRYQQARAEITFARNSDGSFTAIKGAGGVDTLVNVERVQFADAIVALDVDGAAGQTYRLYQAAFDRKPDAAGLGFWIYSMDHGNTLEQVARGFMQSTEFAALYGANPSSEQFVSKLYNNVLHRAPEQAGYDFWVAAVAAGHARSEVLAQFAESPENQAQLTGVLAAGIDYLAFG